MGWPYTPWSMALSGLLIILSWRRKNCRTCATWWRARAYTLDEFLPGFSGRSGACLPGAASWSLNHFRMSGLPILLPNIVKQGPEPGAPCTDGIGVPIQ